jgi:hypothetical protein
MRINSYDSFKNAVNRSLADQGMTRSALAKELENAGFLRAHTVRCLLSCAPVIGRRTPTFSSAIILANAAGYDLALIPKETTDAQ